MKRLPVQQSCSCQGAQSSRSYSGWYAGQGLSNLVEWLKAAAIDREAGLLKALSQAPLPKKVPTEGTQHFIKLFACPGHVSEEHCASI